MINRTTQVLPSEVPRRLAGVEKLVRDFKNKQFIGADTLQVGRVPDVGVLANNVTIAAAGAATFLVNLTPTSSTLSLWNFALSVYVDNDDPNYRFPNGPSISAAQRSMRLYNWLDWADSSDSTNFRCYKVRIENFDSGSHTYYLKFRAYLPYLPGTTAT
jgi:hypothetical protein